LNVFACADIGTAYSFPQQWSRYLRAMQRTQSVGRADTVEVPVEPTTGDPSNTGGKKGRKGKKNDKNASILTAVEARKPAFEDFGMLGRNGISAGAFLASPYAVNSSVPDIQLTLYPTVSTV
jgi:hypothetical protein